jgi:hypothetical protein
MGSLRSNGCGIHFCGKKDYWAYSNSQLTDILTSGAGFVNDCTEIDRQRINMEVLQAEINYFPGDS